MNADPLATRLRRLAAVDDVREVLQPPGSVREPARAPVLFPARIEEA